MWFGGRVGYCLDRKACQDCRVILIILMMVTNIIIIFIMVIVIIIIIIIIIITMQSSSQLSGTKRERAHARFFRFARTF